MKRLSFSETDKAKMIEEFTLSLQNFRSNQDKFTYEKKFSDLTKEYEETVNKPIIYFSMEAWIKMIQLVKDCDKEIAWQATVEKRKFKNKEDSKDFYYYIKQVFVYPQKVTGTFVDTDEVKYAEWSLQLKDEVYNSLRFQGHSHVNMGVTPSATDLNTYQNFLDQLSKDDFYIFMILNKRNEVNIMVYDYAQDMLFENKDCYVDILTSQGSLTKWSEENMKLVEHKTIETPAIMPTTRHNMNSWKEEDWYAQRYGSGTNYPNRITFANEKGYTKDGIWYSFKNVSELVTFYEEHIELIKTAVLSPAMRDYILDTIEEKQTFKNLKVKEKRKPGRPAKGSTK